MELDLFTPLSDAPLDATAAASAAEKLVINHFLHALVAMGMMRVDGSRFCNSQR
jgi:hypothetical protein